MNNDECWEGEISLRGMCDPLRRGYTDLKFSLNSYLKNLRNSDNGKKKHCVLSSICLQLLLRDRYLTLKQTLFILARCVMCLTCGDPSDPWSLDFLASLFFFLWSGLDSRIISSSSNVGSQFSLLLYKDTHRHTFTNNRFTYWILYNIT